MPLKKKKKSEAISVTYRYPYHGHKSNNTKTPFPSHRQHDASHVKPEPIVIVERVFKHDQALEVLLHIFQTTVPDVDDDVRIRLERRLGNRTGPGAAGVWWDVGGWCGVPRGGDSAGLRYRFTLDGGGRWGRTCCRSCCGPCDGHRTAIRLGSACTHERRRACNRGRSCSSSRGRGTYCRLRRGGAGHGLRN